MEADGNRRPPTRFTGTHGAEPTARAYEEQLARLYAECGPAILSFASDYLSSRALAEDVLRDVFVCLWSRAESIDLTGASLRSSLLADARLRCEEIVGSRQAPCSHQGHHNTSSLVPLPFDERLPINLAHFGQLTYKEAAEVLDCSERSVASRMRRGLQRMGRGGAGRA